MNYEILAPAGGEQSAYAALDSGANAIYLGLSRFSAREGAENFDAPALARVVRYAHLLGAKVYVALNTLVKDSEVESFFSSAREAWNGGVDGILLQDIFLGKRLKEVYPQMELHLSTQAGCCNVYGARLAKEYGFSRVVLARETPIEEIKKITRIIETEVFVQGALCSSFSGHCYLSSFAGNNSGNRGRCKQPCRKKYTINRKGYEEEKYALSLSDLCVGERVKELIAAGVYSLKIEGRMRRPEYVAAAVKYYRALLGEERAGEAFSQLKRTYNRGDYTRGLTFGQDERFLSREVQGHIGESVGTLSFRGGKYFCKSSYTTHEGDGFKILRGTQEVGGAQAAGGTSEGFYLSTSARLQVGDTVRVTTDTALQSNLRSRKKTRPIVLSLYFCKGERARVDCGDFTLYGEELSAAKNAPMTQEQLKDCFQKTDGLPLSVSFEEVVTNGVFLPKSQLNALRREFFQTLTERLAPTRDPLAEVYITEPQLSVQKGSMVAAIVTEKDASSADIVVVKPNDYRNLPPRRGEGERYLYLPPFLTQEDEEIFKDRLCEFDGVFGEGYYAIAFAKEHGLKLFAGTGFNLTNRFAVHGVKEAGATYFTLSKELTEGEQRALACKGAFALTAGAIQVMDLIYCPFSHTCASCDKKGVYTLTDEGGREFPLRRYRAGGKYCRFEVYNCAYLASYNGLTSALVDGSLEGESNALAACAFAPDGIKTIARSVTGGHGNRSLL